MPKRCSPISAEDGAATGGDEWRTGNLHGRRCGRPLRQQQRRRLEALLPSLEISLKDWRGLGAVFGRPMSRIRLEIGFGSGEHLAAEAERNPEIGYIGCEPFRNGVAKMVEWVDTRRLDNVRLFLDDAALLLAALAEASIERVDLLYPDPWPKRRQRKRRFVTPETLGHLGRVLIPGGAFHFATDIDDYAGWTLARMLDRVDFRWTAEEAEDWRHPWAPWSSTRYEAKALAEGRVPVYLTFRRL